MLRCQAKSSVTYKIYIAISHYMLINVIQYGFLIGRGVVLEGEGVVENRSR